MIPSHVHMQAVTSSYIAAVGLDRQTSLLYVQFRDGSTWTYGDESKPVLEPLWAGILASRSRGQYFKEHIQSAYPGKQISGRQPIKAEPIPDTSDSIVIATPLYLALLETKKRLRSGSSARFQYYIWESCGQNNEKYQKCRELIIEAIKTANAISEVGFVSPKHLNSAIELAKERRL